MKRRLLFLSLMMSVLVLTRKETQASVTDSVDVLHCRIHVDTLEYANRILRAHTEVRIQAHVNTVASFGLDLLELTVDSVKVGNAHLSWNYNDTLLRIFPAVALNAGDSLEVDIWYHGTPRTDPSGFGGFYFGDTTLGAYVYNIGVGFNSLPHNYGRVWFPCRDIFTDKSHYEFFIRVRNGQTAVCNGTLQNVNPNGDGTSTFHWKLRDPIPSYLAGMAVSDYIRLDDTFISMTGDTIPVRIYVKSTDSSDAMILFDKLRQGAQGFEQRFGPYRWERIGYVAVPFAAGAMEHATSVAYPASFLNGTLNGEYMMAHELSHSWFGNLVTCDKAEEMWLNEGGAAYCEALFYEHVSGRDAFRNYVRVNAAEVLRKAHIDDGGFFAMHTVPLHVTYGKTVYDKGSMMFHSLRGYLGDSLFFGGMKNYFAGHAYGNANNDTLQHVLERYSGRNLSTFFNTWIRQPGFLHYSIDSFSVTPQSGQYQVTVHAAQRSRVATQFCQDNTLELKFIGSARQSQPAVMNWQGRNGNATFTLPFEPVSVFADPDEKLGDATIDMEQLIGAPGSYPYPYLYMQVDADSVADSALVRVTHNWVAPDPFRRQQDGRRLNLSRYWKVEGVFPPGFHAGATFTYNATNSSFNSNAYLDNNWLTLREDSIVMYYRSGPGEDWRELTLTTLNMGSPNDKKGTLTVHDLMPGEYAFGLKDSSVVHRAEEDFTEGITLYPNPARQEIRVIWKRQEPVQWELWGMDGKRYADGKTEADGSIRLQEFPAGMYLVRLKARNGETAVGRITLER